MPKLPPLILLVEDEPSIRDIISDVVDNAGFRIEVAGNFSDGAVLLKSSQPAMLIANGQRASPSDYRGGGTTRSISSKAI